jgi:hypothetical protein
MTLVQGILRVEYVNYQIYLCHLLCSLIDQSGWSVQVSVWFEWFFGMICTGLFNVPIVQWIREKLTKRLLWLCSETSLTGDPGSIVSVGASPRLKPRPSLPGNKWLTHWTSETVYWSEAAGPPQCSPPTTWPGLSPVTVLLGGRGSAKSWMELRKAWLRQPVAKIVANCEQRGPIMASDQGSCGGTNAAKHR